VSAWGHIFTHTNRDTQHCPETSIVWKGAAQGCDAQASYMCIYMRAKKQAHTHKHTTGFRKQKKNYHVSLKRRDHHHSGKKKGIKGDGRRGNTHRKEGEM
jgi:hypothetical protein